VNAGMKDKSKGAFIVDLSQGCYDAHKTVSPGKKVSENNIKSKY
jgi:hypothetical protein